jgi:peptidoglycan/LPS O-acetylase OafA/YrhL
MIAKTEVRADIQGLRAIAVLCVMVFHIWPEALPGGFVGVDVFFVISGFLISSNLLREVDASGSINMPRFYAKRARRLLPASIVVTAATIIASIFVLPANEWADAAQQAIASLFYFQNWLLVWNSVDYLAAEAAPSPFQHFWSLSVEEQFYLIWPPLILAGLDLPVRAMTRRLKIALVMGILFGCSLLLSALFSGSGSAAYFGTHIRLWELAVGGLFAATRFRTPPAASGVIRAIGIGLIVYSAYFFSAATVFPGVSAFIPTFGAVFIILSEKSMDGRESLILSNRFLGYVGDISYSLYLWHWPITVLTKTALDRSSLGFDAGALVLAASLALSIITKRHVEDRFRIGSQFRLARREFALAAGAAMVPLLSSLGIIAYIFQMEAIAIDPTAYPGGKALSGSAVPNDVGYYPDLSAVLHDRSEVYDNGCHLKFTDVEPKGCEFGDQGGKEKIFLVGDSHAVNWLPALDELAVHNHWSGTSFTKSSCPLQPFTMTLRDAPYSECREWVVRMLNEIRKEKPDVIILGYMAHFKLYDDKFTALKFEIELKEFWKQLAGTSKVILIADTPEWPEDPNKCLTAGKTCISPIKNITGRDPIYEAATASGGIVGVVDMNPYICPNLKCKPVVGNVRVWRDRHHLTATYSRSISGFLETQLDGLLKMRST